MAYVADDIWEAILKYVPDATDLLNLSEAFHRDLRPFMTSVRYKTKEKRLLDAHAAINMVVHTQEQVMPKVRKLVMYTTSESVRLPSELQELEIRKHNSVDLARLANLLMDLTDEIPIIIEGPYPTTLTSIRADYLIELKEFPPYLTTASMPFNSISTPIPDTLTDLHVHTITPDILRNSQLRKLMTSSMEDKFSAKDLPESLTDCSADLSDDVWESDLSRFVRLKNGCLFGQASMGFDQKELSCHESRLPFMIQKVGLRPVINVFGFSSSTMELSTKFKVDWYISCEIATLGQLPDTTVRLNCRDVDSTHFGQFPSSLTKLDIATCADPDILVHYLNGTKIKILSFPSNGTMTKRPPTLEVLRVRQNVRVAREVLEGLSRFTLNTHNEENAKRHALDILQLKGFVYVGMSLKQLRTEAEVNAVFTEVYNSAYRVFF